MISHTEARTEAERGEIHARKKARTRRMRKIRNTRKNLQLNKALLWSMKSMSRTKRTERNSMPRQRTAPIPSVRSPDLKLRGSILNCAHFVRWSTSILRRSKSRFLFACTEQSLGDGLGQPASLISAVGTNIIRMHTTAGSCLGMQITIRFGVLYLCFMY